MSIKNEQYDLTTGMRRDIPEDKRSKMFGSQIPYMYSLINIQPGTVKGELERSPGFTLISDLGTKKPVQNLIFSKQSEVSLSGLTISSITRCTAASNGKIFDIDNVLNTTPIVTEVSSIFSPDNYIGLIPCFDLKLANVITIVDGLNIPYKYDFLSVTPLIDTTIAYNNNFVSSFGIFKNNRLWLNRILEPGRMGWSKGGDITDHIAVNDAGSLNVGDGDTPLTAIGDIFISQSKNADLLLAKRDRLYAITGNNGDMSSDTRFQWYNISEATDGTDSPSGLVRIGNDALLLGRSDITQYSSLVSPNGVIKPVDIFTPLRNYYREIVNTSKAQDFWAIFNNEEGLSGRIYNFMCRTNLAKNNYAFSFDRTGAWFLRDFYQYSFKCGAVNPDDGHIYLGSYDGKIYRMDKDKYSYAGNDYISFMDTGFSNYGVSSDIKYTTDDCQMEMEVSDDLEVDLTYIKKSSRGQITSTKQSVMFSTYRSKYNQSYYDESYYSPSVGQLMPIDIDGVFDSLAVQFSAKAKDVYFKFKNLDLYVNI
jgi:hypothetical protein